MADSVRPGNPCRLFPAPRLLLLVLSVALHSPGPAHAAFFGSVGILLPQKVDYYGLASLTNFTFNASPSPPPPPSPPPWWVPKRGWKRPPGMVTIPWKDRKRYRPGMFVPRNKAYAVAQGQDPQKKEELLAAFSDGEEGGPVRVNFVREEKDQIEGEPAAGPASPSLSSSSERQTRGSAPAVSGAVDEVKALEEEEGGWWSFTDTRGASAMSDEEEQGPDQGQGQGKAGASASKSSVGHMLSKFISRIPGTINAAMKAAASALPSTSPAGPPSSSATSFLYNISSVTRKNPGTYQEAILNFQGLGAWDARYAGTGMYAKTNDFNMKASAGGCAGNGFLIQLVNRAIQVYSVIGNGPSTPKRLSPVVPFNQFLSLTPYLQGTSTGDDVLRGSCVYDRKVMRFYMLFQWRSTGAASVLDQFGQSRPAAKSGSGLLIAVSTGADPRAPWRVYFVPSSNDGLNSADDTTLLQAQSPPYYNDQTSLTVNDGGVFVTGTQFGQTGNLVAYNIYALGKSLFNIPQSFMGRRIAVSAAQVSGSWGQVVPIRYPGDAHMPYDNLRGGTAWFACLGAGQTINVLAVTGTETLSSASPVLAGYIATTQVPYYNLVAQGGVFQRAAFRASTLNLGAQLGKAQPRIFIGADGTMPTTISAALQHGVGGGRLKDLTSTVWITWNVGFGSWAAAALAQLHPMFRQAQGGAWTLSLSLYTYRVVNLNQQSLMYPALGFNRAGRGVLIMTVAGQNFYPTATFLKINETGGLAQQLFLTGAGNYPLDNNDAYRGNGITRFGDPHTVYIDDQGSAWGFAEYVEGNAGYQNQTTTPFDPQGNWANWATRVWQVNMQSNNGSFACC